jgi:hypothetical protein
MKQKLILFLFGLVFLSMMVQAQSTEKDKTKLHSISEIRALLELSDVGYYSELTNEPTNALEYRGEKKTAANMGVYAADLLYVVATSENENIFQEYGAIMELAKNEGLTDDIPAIILKRYEDGNATAEEVIDMLDNAMEKSEAKMSEQNKQEFFAYFALGNYIEKLYLVSSIIERPKQTDVPAEVEATLKRNLIRYIGAQSIRLQGMLDIVTLYPDDTKEVVDARDIKLLMDQYKYLESNREQLLQLSAEEFFNEKNIKAIFKQIKKIRERIVKV